MKNVYAFLFAIVIATAFWLIRGGVDSKVSASKTSEISSLHDLIRTEELALARSDEMVKMSNSDLKNLQEKVQAMETQAGNDRAEIQTQKDALKTLADSDKTNLQSVEDGDKAAIQALQEQVRSDEQQLQVGSEKLAQVIASYETQLADFRSKASKPEIGDAIYPGDDGFDAQNVGTGFFSYRYFGKSIRNPTNVEMPPSEANQTPWVFARDAGIAANNSGFYVSNATNGNNNAKTSQMGQAAFLEFRDSSISQIVKLPKGSFSVSFDYEARRDYTPNTVAVSLDGNVLFKGAPADTQHFASVTTDSVKLKAGNHMLKFLALGDGAETNYPCTFIDNVRINVLDPRRSTAKNPSLKDAAAESANEHGE